MNTTHTDKAHTKRIADKHVLESERAVPVRAEVDVVVCGGGPAGVGAALAAAREGARTLLIERFGMLGGMWTAGLVNPFFESTDRGYMVQDLCDQLQAAGAWRPWLFAYTFDPEIMRRTLESMMAEAGAEFLYYTQVVDAVVQDGQVRGVVIESKAGREAVLAKVVIDATGDGDVAARSGCAYEFGREEDGAVQPVTLMFEVQGAAHFDQKDAAPLYDKMCAAIQKHKLDIEMPVGRCGYAPWIITLPCHGLSAVQTTHVYRVNPLDPASLTQATVDARQQAADMVTVLRHVPGFEEVRLLHTAPSLGLREGRRVAGRERLTYEHVKTGARFVDAVTTCSFGVDVHDPDPDSDTRPRPEGRSRCFEVPFGCLVPRDVEGLLLAGRCISGDHLAHGAYRVTGTAMGMGQAAGLAAAQAVQAGVLPSAMDGEALRQALTERGVAFLTDAQDRAICD